MEFVTLNRETFKKYLQEFADLYTLCFHVPMNAEEVAWRYLDNPNAEILSCVAIDNGKLVANYSAEPVLLQHNGKVLKVALSLNTMTHPDYMGQGLFVKLASSVYRYMYENGYQMIFGFPNNISNRTFVNKLGWHDIRIEPTLQIDVNRAHKKPAMPEIRIISDDSFSLDYSGARCQNGTGIYKTREYLKWRYYQNPSVQYHTFVVCGPEEGKVSSRVTVKEFRDRVNVVDSFFACEAELCALINHVIDFALEKGKALITVWSGLGTWEHLLLESYGATLAIPVTYFGANVFGKEVDPEEFYHSEAWHLDMGDDNVY